VASDTFLHLTDFHFWEIVANPFRLLGKRALGNLNVLFRRRHEFVLSRVETHLEYVRSIGAPTALLTGDFTSTSTGPEFEAAARMARWLDDRGLNVLAIPGNHDVYTWRAHRGRTFEKYFDAWFPEEGLPAKRTLPGGVDLVLVPTVAPDFQSRGRITGVEVEGVRELLRTANEPLVVAGHYPVLHETYAYNAPPQRQLRNAEALRHVLGSSGKAILYLSGHVHRFSYVTDRDFPNLRHVTTGAFFRTAHEAGTIGEFSEISVNDQGFSVVRHTMRDNWTVEPIEPLAG
jgi:3',5'-cyclic AMP phosphodiesterase CpdA